MTARPVAAVLGLGLLGTSLGLALRQSGRYEAVVGWDPDFDAARLAQKRAAVDRFARTAQEAVRGAGAVFVAVSHGLLQETLSNAAPHVQPGAVVAGLGESQEVSLELAAGVLPRNVSFVAAHPVLWEAIQADTEPSPALLRRGVLCVAPSTAAHPEAVGYLTDVAASLGMETRFLEAREHDAFFSGVSQLPAVLAAALLRTVTSQPAWREVGHLAGGDLRAGTSLVDGEAARRQEALAANREHVVRWLDALTAELTALRNRLQDGEEPGDLFSAAAEVRQRWLKERQQPAGFEDEAAATVLPPARKRFLF